MPHAARGQFQLKSVSMPSPNICHFVHVLQCCICSSEYAATRGEVPELEKYRVLSLMAQCACTFLHAFSARIYISSLSPPAFARYVPEEQPVAKRQKLMLSSYN